MNALIGLIRIVGVVALSALGAAIYAQSVDSLVLIDANSDSPVAGFSPIPNGAVIDTSITGTALNIRAITTPDPTGSVKFALSGATTHNQTESVAPYALYGDSPAGDYTVGSLNNGAHTLTATPFTGGGGNGTEGTPLTITFTVVDGPPPIFSVSAGPDRSLLLPSDSLVLQATTANGTPQTFSWSQDSGPTTATLSGQNTSALTASD
ncbi:MAG: hypothetical protein WBG04_05350, partial [Haloferula sp.]